MTKNKAGRKEQGEGGERRRRKGEGGRRENGSICGVVPPSSPSPNGCIVIISEVLHRWQGSIESSTVQHRAKAEQEDKPRR